MILLDVNVLVYAFRESAVEHERYAHWLGRAIKGPEVLLLVDLVLVGFVRIVTNPQVVEPVATPARATEFVDVLRGSSQAQLAHTSQSVWDRISTMVREDPQIKANLVTDAYLAAVALTHGARVATRDRGFARYPGLRWFDPGAASV